MTSLAMVEERPLTAYSADELRAFLPLCEGLPLAAGVAARIAELEEAEAAATRDYQARAAAIGAQITADIRAGGDGLEHVLLWLWNHIETQDETESLVIAAALGPLAAEKHRAAMTLIGRAHIHGTCGFPRDHRLAFEWFNRSARAGNHDGAAWLARAYQEGIGVEADLEQAIHWYGVGADWLSLEAMVRLAEILHKHALTPLAKDRLPWLHTNIIEMYDRFVAEGRAVSPDKTRMDIYLQFKAYVDRYRDWQP